MASESTPQAIALRSRVREPPSPRHPLAQRLSCGGGSELACRISRQLSIALSAINVASAATTYVFVVYVLPLPGAAPPAAARRTVLICAVAMTAVAWAVCEAWGRRSFAPVRQWLDGEGEPTDGQRSRAIRLPMHQAGHSLAIWTVAAVAFAALDVSLGGSIAAGILVIVMVLLGGLVASALSYLATERIMRPAMALVLEYGPPVRPLLPGIATRIYLAWDFGTAVAVAGGVVVAITYLAGAGISPRRLAATVIFLGGVALTVGLITLLIAIRSISDPIRALRRAMASVEAGDTDVSVPVDDGGEVGLLQAGFNRMMAGLRERDRVRELFGRHVGEEVARSALGREISRSIFGTARRRR